MKGAINTRRDVLDALRRCKSWSYDDARAISDWIQGGMHDDGFQDLRLHCVVENAKPELMATEIFDAAQKDYGFVMKG